MKKLLLIFILFTPSLSPNNAQELSIVDPAVPVFVRGEEGYACFRIPAIIKTPSGDLLAFVEGRKNGCSDTGNIDLVGKRSEDGGKSWGPLQLIWDDQENTCGNPAPIVDDMGNIHLLLTWNLGEDRESEIIEGTSKDTRRVFYLHSADKGNTWSVPREITGEVKKPDWTWYATGPGSGIELQMGPHEGRLMIGCDHIEAGTKKYFSHIIYSDDLGKTWHLGGSSPKDQVNECEVIELASGQLVLNMRNYDREKKTRQKAYSTDGGQTWVNQHHDTTLIEPICQASSHLHNDLLLFSNPASSNKRIRMTVRGSRDGGQSWPLKKLLHEGPSAYSDLITIDAQTIGCFYERGHENPYEQMVFQRITIVTN